jgi:hypothetical protein
MSIRQTTVQKSPWIQPNSAALPTPQERADMEAEAQKRDNIDLHNENERAATKAWLKKRNAEDAERLLFDNAARIKELEGRLDKAENDRAQTSIKQAIEAERTRINAEQTGRSALAQSASTKINGSAMILANGMSVEWNYPKESFGWRKEAGDEVYMYHGFIRNGDTFYRVNDTRLTLTNDTEYVYAQLNRSNLSTGIYNMATMPHDNDTYHRFPIVAFKKYEDQTGSGTYAWRLHKVYNTGDPQVAGADAFQYTRFRLDYTDSETMTVNAGTYYAQGGANTATSPLFVKSDTAITGVGNDDDGFAASFADAKHYVYLEKINASNVNGRANIPNALNIVCSTSFPTHESMKKIFWMLGEFTVTSGAVVASSLIRYWIGDIVDVSVVPDGNITSLNFKSLEFKDNGTGPDNRLQLWKFDDKSVAGTLTDDDEIVIRKAVGAGEEITYARGKVVMETWAHYIPDVDISHDGTDGAEASTVHDEHNDERYWRLGGNNINCYGAAIGNTGQEAVINLSNAQLLVGASGQLSVDWDDFELWSDDTSKLSVDYGGHALWYNEAMSADWANRILYSSGGNPQIKWDDSGDVNILAVDDVKIEAINGNCSTQGGNMTMYHAELDLTVLTSLKLTLGAVSGYGHLINFTDILPTDKVLVFRASK